MRQHFIAALVTITLVGCGGSSSSPSSNPELGETAPDPGNPDTLQPRGPDAVGLDTSSLSCAAQAQCGKRASTDNVSFCWCDEDCESNNDCCDDFAQECEVGCDAGQTDCGTDGLAIKSNAIPEPYGWTYYRKVHGEIDGADTYVTCRDGSKSGYAISLGRNGEENNVLIRIEGGGACFNEHSCILSPYEYNEYWFHKAVVNDPLKFHILPIRPGVFNREKDENPFKDWTYVYVPHCTGDVGVGQNSDQTIPGLEVPFPLPPFGPGFLKKTNTFQGWNNFEIIVNDLLKQLETATDSQGDEIRVDRYILSGDSAGGFGAIGHYKHFKSLVEADTNPNRNPDVVIDVLNDSGAPIATGPEGLASCLQDRMWEKWGLKNTVGNNYCPSCGPESFLLPMAVEAITAVATAGRYAGFEDSQHDKILAGFFGFGLDDCRQLDEKSVQGPTQKHTPLTPEQYETALRAGLDQMVQAAVAGHGGPDQPNFRYFILAGDDHASNQLPALYTRTSNGVRLIDWVTGLANENDSGEWNNVAPWTCIDDDSSADSCGDTRQ